MRGEHHVLLSLCTAAVLLAPAAAHLPPFSLFVVLLGVFIGSLAPDADATDAAIFHGRGRGLRALLPLFGYTLRYLIYYPLSFVFRFRFGSRVRPRHRGLLHSAIGVTLASILIALYLWLALLGLGISSHFLLILFGLGFFSGCILHLVEDSCTAMGVAWWFPFRTTRLQGRLNTRDAGDLRPILFGAVLAMGAALLLMSPKLLGVPSDLLPWLSPALVGALWTLFLISAGVHRGS